MPTPFYDETSLITVKSPGFTFVAYGQRYALTLPTRETDAVVTDGLTTFVMEGRPNRWIAVPKIEVALLSPGSIFRDGWQYGIADQAKLPLEPRTLQPHTAFRDPNSTYWTSLSDEFMQDVKCMFGPALHSIQLTDILRAELAYASTNMPAIVEGHRRMMDFFATVSPLYIV